MDHVIELAGVMLVIIGIPLGFIFIGHPLAKAFGRRLEGRSTPDPALLDELDALRDQVASMGGRIVELEERVDFAERLLAQHADPQRVGPGEVH